MFMGRLSRPSGALIAVDVHLLEEAVTECEDEDEEEGEAYGGDGA